MTQNWKRWAAPAGAIAAAALLAACSSSSSTGATSTASATSSTSAGVAAAEAAVTQFEATTTSYAIPTASISGVSALKGKTFYYIPLISDIPGAVVTAATLKTALAAVGASLQVCNGEAQPTVIASCVTQATGAGAAGIIVDEIPFGMAENSLNAAEAKDIPIIVADQYAPSGTTNTDKVTYVQGVVNQPTQIADWIIANSDGKANLVIGEEADSTSSIQYVVNSEATYKSDCPSCTLKVDQITEAEASEVQSQASSYIDSDPSATYYYTEFEDSLESTLAAVPLDRKSSLNIVTAGASVYSLGLLAKGEDNVKAAVAVDQAYEGWALADEILRMATKSAPVTETLPSRLFDASNIGSISVTTAAQADGAWFGNDSYQAAFEKLWGV